MLLTACHDIPGYDNTRRDNFECLWRLVDEHYCFFDSESEDWQAIGDRYRPQADTARTTRCLLYTSPSPRDRTRSRMPSSA